MDSSWVEKIPVEEFDDVKNLLMTQLSATQWSRNMEFYRKTHLPLNATHLMRFMYSKVVWWDEEVFLMKRKLPVTVRSKFRKGTSKIDFARRGEVFIYGMTKQSVAQAIEEVLYLMDESTDVVHIGRYSDGEARSVTPTTFITSRFLAECMKVNPNRQLYFCCGCNLSVEESVAIASHSEPLNVGLDCSFADHGRAFVEALARRTTHVGTIAVSGRFFDDRYAMSSFLEPVCDVRNVLLKISVKTSTWDFEVSKRLLPLSLPTMQLVYHVYQPIEMGDIESLTIVPKAVTLIFHRSLLAKFYTKFLQASGNLVELGLVYNPFGTPPSKGQEAELLHAIQTNQNLLRLQLGYLNVLADFWEELLAVIGSHSSLRSVLCWVLIDQNLVEEVNTLIPFLQKHRHLHISFKNENSWQLDSQRINAILEPVRVLNCVNDLTRQSINDRPTIFSTALTCWASGSSSRFYLLLSENADLLCSLLGDPPSGETQHQRKRQRPL